MSGNAEQVSQESVGRSCGRTKIHEILPLDPDSVAWLGADWYSMNKMASNSNKRRIRNEEKPSWEPLDVSRYQKTIVPFASRYGMWKGKVKFSENEINRAKIKAGH